MGASLVFISVTQGVEGGASERRSFALKDELQAVGVERRPNKKDGAKFWMRSERGCSGTGKSLGAQPSRVSGLQGPGLSHVLHPHLAWQCGAEQAAGARDEGYKWRSCDLRSLVSWGEGPGSRGREKGQEDAGPVLEASNSEALVQKK